MNERRIRRPSFLKGNGRQIILRVKKIKRCAIPFLSFLCVLGNRKRKRPTLVIKVFVISPIKREARCQARHCPHPKLFVWTHPHGRLRSTRNTQMLSHYPFCFRAKKYLKKRNDYLSLYTINRIWYKTRSWILCLIKNDFFSRCQKQFPFLFSYFLVQSENFWLTLSPPLVSLNRTS